MTIWEMGFGENCFQEIGFWILGYNGKIIIIWAVMVK